MANTVYDPEQEGSKTTGSSDDISRLRTQESAGSNQAGGNSWASTNSTNSSGGGAVNSANAGEGGSTNSTSANEGGSTTSTTDDNLYNPSGDQKDTLKKAEESAGQNSEESEDDDDTLGKGYTASSKGRRQVKVTRRKAAIGGAAGILVGIFLVGITIVQGPLEIVHFAQMLDRFHFTALQDAENSRLVKAARFIKDPSKPEKVRMGIVGNKIADRIEKRIHERTGLKTEYKNGKQSWVVDRDHPFFKDKTPAQVEQKLVSLGYDKATVTNLGPTNGKDVIVVDPSKDIKKVRAVKTYLSETKFARAALGNSGLNKVSSYAGSRILERRAGWTFHPIKKLDNKIQLEALKASGKGITRLKEEWAKQRANFINNGSATPNKVDAKDNSEKDKDGNPTDSNKTEGAKTQSNETNSVNPDAEKAAKDTNDGKDGVKQFKDKLSVKVAGSAAGAAGVLCVVRSLDKSVNEAKYDKALLPMMRQASSVLSTGSQIQSGLDISMLQAGFIKDLLTEKDKDGNVTSTWNQAKSIQAESGEPATGPDIPESGQVFDGNPTAFVNDIPGLGAVCGVLESPIGIGIGILSGPVNFVVSSVVMQKAIGMAAGWLSGSPVNPLAAGADFGNFANYGARLSANDQFASAGGAQLNEADEVAIKSASNGLNTESFQQKGIAYRLFNIYDNQSLASRVMDKSNISSDVSQNIASSFTNIGSIFSAVLRMPGSMITTITHADTNQTYDYHGLKKVGFTAEQLNDPRFENPFDNACHVVGCPGKSYSGIFEDKGKADKYTELAKKCFGTTITNSGSDDAPTWNIDKSSGSVNMYGADYPADECKSNDEDWLRIRFWLLDTATLEGYDCSQGGSDSSDESCKNSGFDPAASNTADNSVSTGTMPSGSAKELATQLLPYIADGKISCNFQGANCPDIQGTAKGSSIKTGSCRVDSLSPNLVGMILHLAQEGHKIVFSALCSDHPSNAERSQHTKGEAADFNIIDGVFMGPSATAKWDQQKLEAARKLDRDAAAVIPKKGSQFGQLQCGVNSFTFLDGWNVIEDGCHHQHIGVGK